MSENTEIKKMVPPDVDWSSVGLGLGSGFRIGFKSGVGLGLGLVLGSPNSVSQG